MPSDLFFEEECRGYTATDAADTVVAEIESALFRLADEILSEPHVGRDLAHARATLAVNLKLSLPIARRIARQCMERGL